MKKFLILILFPFLFVSCGQQSSNEEAGLVDVDSLAVVNKERSRIALPQSLNKSDTDGLYEAKINKEGEVNITFNNRVCTRLARKVGLPLLISKSTTVEGLNQSCAGIMHVKLGKDRDPYLVLISARGRVAIMSIIDAITKGDLHCSGPLHGINNVSSVIEEFGKDGHKVLASMDNGETKPILSSKELAGYYLVDSLEVQLTSDWNISMDDNLKEFHHLGSFYLTQSEGPDSLGNTSHNLMVNFPDRTYSLTFQIEPKEFRTNYFMTFYADDEFPLSQGERIKVRYNKTSQLGVVDDGYEEELEEEEE